MSIDQRRSPRVEFFLVPAEHEQLPVWIFKPEGLADARAGIVVNLSEEGLQILIAAEPSLDAQHYELRLLLGEDDGVPLFSAAVRLVWSRPLSRIVQVGGFEFESANSQAEEFLRTQTAQITARKWVRCVLVERMTALA
ncbi:MAG: PilZ domain-containing protein [Proteobacteria bacterium]|jgi:PilZ domain|uniref:PilZ domain-containing protein n=2 Tax=Pseudomonadota TaxID=1224 RepID=UPI000F9C556D|nr:hypothetical protein [Methylibium sp.]MBY0367772.1 PilZ domain-containing protein [Burkholderiaceae bacterium]MCH8855399.1 PilZ domain-containing protein [Pseudomonadota bacterium]RTL24443.1 MAG: PilZ domain-containing protein [Burkholderiales bacterium]|mmetsp:Transcript_44536/g.104532  ORF Transcript_44536/g.104532 Transcript_44536/m.104532 type:complete len:139 (-) Transcript_44536:1616-2032(-)